MVENAKCKETDFETVSEDSSSLVMSRNCFQIAPRLCWKKYGTFLNFWRNFVESRLKHLTDAAAKVGGKGYDVVGEAAGQKSKHSRRASSKTKGLLSYDEKKANHDFFVN